MNENPPPPQTSGTPGPYPASGPAPQGPPGGQPGRSGVDSFFDGIRRTGLYRSEQRWIGGVGGGVAQRLGIDPLIARGIFGVSILLGGLGLVAYGLGWLLLPEQRDGRIHLQQLFRGDFDVAVLGGFAVFLTGLSFPDNWFPGRWWGADSGWWHGVMWLSVIAVVVVLVISAANSRPRGPSGPRTTLYPGQPSAWPGGPGPAAPIAPQAQTAPADAGPSEGSPTMEPTAQPAATDPVASGQPSTYPATGQPYPGAAQATAQYPTTSYPTQQYPAQQYGTQQYGAQQYGTQAGNRGAAPGGAYATGPRTALPPQGPTTALPRVASPRGPGSGASGVIVALSLLTFAALLYAQKVGSFEGPVLLTAGAVALILIGVGIIVAGLRGRTSGGLTALAIVLALVVVPGVAIDRTDWDIDGRWGSDTAFGEIDETPLDAATAEAGYSLGAGDARIDLTEVPLTGATVEVPVSLGAGDLTIVIPQDAAVTATIQVMAGEVRWLDESSSTGMPGSRGDQTYESPAVRDGATPDLELDLTVGAGTVRVMEENR